MNTTSPHLTLREQMFYLRQLSFLLGAGMPLTESLDTLIEQTRGKSRRALFQRIRDDTASGIPFSKSIRMHAESFDVSVPSLVEIGELSGTLAQNLLFLSEELERKQSLRKKILGALMYPFIVAVSTVVLVGTLIVFIFPKIVPIFIGMDIELPWTTRALLATSTFLISYGIYLLFLVPIVCMGCVRLYKKTRLKRYVDTLLLHLPLIGNMVRDYTLAHFCRTLHVLLTSTMTLPEALEVTAHTLHNDSYVRALSVLKEQTHAGKPLSLALKSRPDLFPHAMVNMIAVGEHTGKLPDTCAYLARLYETAVDTTTKNLSTTVEPLLMLCMGLAVGGIAISIIAPMYEITEHLQRR